MNIPRIYNDSPLEDTLNDTWECYACSGWFDGYSRDYFNIDKHVISSTIELCSPCYCDYIENGTKKIDDEE